MPTAKKMYHNSTLIRKSVNNANIPTTWKCQNHWDVHQTTSKDQSYSTIKIWKAISTIQQAQLAQGFLISSKYHQLCWAYIKILLVNHIMVEQINPQSIIINNHPYIKIIIHNTIYNSKITLMTDNTFIRRKSTTNALTTRTNSLQVSKITHLHNINQLKQVLWWIIMFTNLR